MISTDTIAGIDVGSNAIRLIIKDIIPGDTFKNSFIKKRAYIRLPLRLGGDVFQYGYIKKNKEKQFLKAMKIFQDLMGFYDVNEYDAVATSATRSAKNGEEIVQKILVKTGIIIKVITGKDEAELLSRTNKFDLPEGEIFLSADLGGGSLQLSVYSGTKVMESMSFKIGTIRMINNSIDQNEITKMHLALKRISETYGELSLIGAGGNINKISKMAHEKTLKFEDIEKIFSAIEPLSIEERMMKYNFRYDRADVIVPAAELYMNIMTQMGLGKIYIPKVGIADAVIYDLFLKRYNKTE